MFFFNSQKHVNESQKFETEKKSFELSLEEANRTIEELKKAEKTWESKLASREDEAKKHASEVEKLRSELDKLTKSLDESKQAQTDSERVNHSNQLKFRESILTEAIKNAEQVVKDALHLYDDPILYKCKSSADYLLAKLQPFGETLTDLITLFNKLVSFCC